MPKYKVAAGQNQRSQASASGSAGPLDRHPCTAIRLSPPELANGRGDPPDPGELQAFRADPLGQRFDQVAAAGPAHRRDPSRQRAVIHGPPDVIRDRRLGHVRLQVKVHRYRLPSAPLPVRYTDDAREAYPPKEYPVPRLARAVSHRFAPGVRPPAPDGPRAPPPAPKSGTTYQ